MYISDPRFSYIDLSSSETRLIAIRGLHVVPIISGARLLDANKDEDNQLFAELGHPSISTRDFFEAYVVPNIGTQPPWLIDPLIRIVFDSFSVSVEWFKQLQHVPFVAVQRRDGTSGSSRLTPAQIIDKTAPIAALYFDDEEVFGSGIYLANGRYHNQLKILGEKTHFDSEIADNRIRKFANLKPNKELFKKYRTLVKFLSDSESTVGFKPEWVSLLRLPARSTDNHNVLLSASACRPSHFRPLVEGVLGLVSIDIKKSLQQDLGWNKTLEPTLIGSRINVIVKRSTYFSAAEIDLLAVFEYISEKAADLGSQIKNYINEVKAQVSVEKYIPGLGGGLWSCDTVFFRDAREFEPYLSVIPVRYAHVFGDIIKLFGVADCPSPQCLLNVLNRFPKGEILDPNDLNVVIRILGRLHNFDNFNVDEILVPSLEGKLHRINDFSPTNTVVRLGHPQVPADFAFKYSIPQIHDDSTFFRHLSEDDEFGDYCQEEQITTRIANTLKEYSLSTSFNEFIANAEDCGSATQVSWYLDANDAQFPTDNLFNEKLGLWQTPALYIYNDGVFSESDFKAFINTGGGSKAADPSKIGKYGLGSLTMYHFTDIPSMISGGYFVIFDPSRRYLPLCHGRRRGGIRVPLSIMKLKYQGHLVPFVDIGKYSLGIIIFA